MSGVLLLPQATNTGVTPCPLCCRTFDGEIMQDVARHLVECGTQWLRGQTSSTEKEEVEEESPRRRKRRMPPVVGNNKKKHKMSSSDEEEEEEEGLESQGGEKDSRKVDIELPKISTTKPVSTSPAKKKSMTEQEYDEFLRTVKEGRLIRLGKWSGMSKGVEHRCADAECGRKWKPIPSQVLADDYYCPSCVLHHRNNMERFKIPRLKWTAKVPNTFYVFSIDDPKDQCTLVKFGRTQHYDAWKRYPAKERKGYNMKLLLSIRGRLKTMTKIENWWKTEAEAKGYFKRFSEESFHGLSECVDVSKEVLQELLQESKVVALADAKLAVKIVE